MTTFAFIRQIFESLGISWKEATHVHAYSPGKQAYKARNLQFCINKTKASKQVKQGDRQGYPECFSKFRLHA